jgi:hypothetical protein
MSAGNGRGCCRLGTTCQRLSLNRWLPACCLLFARTSSFACSLIDWELKAIVRSWYSSPRSVKYLTSLPVSEIAAFGSGVSPGSTKDRTYVPSLCCEYYVRAARSKFQPVKVSPSPADRPAHWSRSFPCSSGTKSQWSWTTVPA